MIIHRYNTKKLKEAMKLKFLFLLLIIPCIYANTVPNNKEVIKPITTDNIEFIKQINSLVKDKDLNKYFFHYLINFLRKDKDYVGLQYLKSELEKMRTVKNCVIINKLQFRIEQAIGHIQDNCGLPIL